VRAAALAGLAVLLAAPPAWSGAWPMEQGRIQAISSIYLDAADRGFDGDGDASLDADFEKIESSTFVEWGVTPRLTLFAQPVVQHVTLRAPDGRIDEATGFASSQVGARWLLGRPFGGVVSIQGAIVAPGATENVSNVALGEGGAASELRLLLGRGWGGERRGAFVDGQVGYRWRNDGFPSETRLDATFGVRASPEWMFLAQSFSSWRDGDDPADFPGDIPLMFRESETHKGQISVVRRLNDTLSFQVGGFGTYAGRNVVEERAGFAALWIRLDP
jgi:hypothetical protein